MQTIDPVATGGIPDAGILGGGWGLGLLREEFPCGEAWGHDAEHLGYMTAAWTSGDGTRQVAVIVNSGLRPRRTGQRRHARGTRHRLLRRGLDGMT